MADTDAVLRWDSSSTGRHLSVQFTAALPLSSLRLEFERCGRNNCCSGPARARTAPTSGTKQDGQAQQVVRAPRGDSKQQQRAGRTTLDDRRSMYGQGRQEGGAMVVAAASPPPFLFHLPRASERANARAPVGEANVCGAAPGAASTVSVCGIDRCRDCPPSSAMRHQLVSAFVVHVACSNGDRREAGRSIARRFIYKRMPYS
jgi:hypothetical protein